MIKEFHYMDIEHIKGKEFELFIGVTFENQNETIISPSIQVNYDNGKINGMFIIDEGFITDFQLVDLEIYQVTEYIKQNENLITI